MMPVRIYVWEETDAEIERLRDFFGVSKADIVALAVTSYGRRIKKPKVIK